MPTWFEMLAPSLRSVFTGSLIANFDTPHPDYRVPSYDLVGITLDHYELDLKAFRTTTSAGLGSLLAAANASGIDWLVCETYYYWSESAVQRSRTPGMLEWAR